MESNMQPQKGSEPLNKNLLAVCATVIVVCILIIAAVLYGRSVPPKVANTNTGVNATPTQVAVDISKVNIAGDPFVGNVSAPVVIAFWSDYQCPFCKQAETQVLPQIYTDYVVSGKAKIVFKDWAFLGADSQTLGQWARAVWAVAPDKFWQWNQEIFTNQGTENTGWATHAKILSLTTTALGAADTNKVSALVASNTADYQKAMDADKAEGTSFGINGTPGTIIGKQFISGAQDYTVFKAAIDQVLAGK